MGGFKLFCTTKEKEAYIPSLGYISDIRFSQSKQNDKYSCDFCMRAKDSDDGSQLTAVPVDDSDGDDKTYDDGRANVCLSPSIRSVETHSLGQISGGPCNYCECIWEGTLTASAFYEVMDAGIIDFPTISKAEINDRSKSDLLNKAIASMQITWFIIQVIARLIQGLSISQLELTTTALAVINVTMYFFWLQKPFDVHYPVAIPTHSVVQLRTRRCDRDSSIYEETRDMGEAWLSQLLHVVRNVVLGIFRFVEKKFVLALNTSRDAHARRCQYITMLGKSKERYSGGDAYVSMDAARMNEPFRDGHQSTLVSPPDGGTSASRDYDDRIETIHSDSNRASSPGTCDMSHTVSQMEGVSQRPTSAKKATQDSSFLPLRENTALALLQRLLYCGSLLVTQIAICITLPAFLLQGLAWILGDTPLAVIIMPRMLLGIDEDAYKHVRKDPLLKILEDSKLRMALFASIFYSETNSGVGNTYIVGTVAGSVFAAMHVSAIWLAFPSIFEKWLWAASSLLLIVACMSFVFLGICARLSTDIRKKFWILFRQNNRGWTGAQDAVMEDYDRGIYDNGTKKRFQWPGMSAGGRTALIILFLILTSYGLVRIGILIMSFTLLRELPESALVKISWSDLLPHI